MSNREQRRLLSPEWQAVAECVDAYEASEESGDHNLRAYVDRVPAEFRLLALCELIRVDAELRRKQGQPRAVAEYLDDFPEIARSEALRRGLLEEAELANRSGTWPQGGETTRRQISQQDVSTADEDTSPSTAPTTSLEAHRRRRRAAPLPPPEKIGRYVVESRVGTGTFGVVYRCYDADLDRHVAIKIAHAPARSTAHGRQEFLHEARSAARVNHKGIVRVLDAGVTDDERPYIVYELIEGESLRARIKSGRYSLDDTIRWITAVAEALHHAHKRGLVHRDVKPANILIDSESDARLTDFGLATVDDRFFTRDSGTIGTLAYMSPEQAAGQSNWATSQTDLYSLGVVLYEMLCRRRPFVAEEPAECVRQILHRTPTPPRAIDDRISPALEAVCQKAIAKQPTDRFNTGVDLAAALWAAHQAESKTRGRLAGLARNVILFAALVGVSLGVAWFFRPQAERPEVSSLKFETEISSEGRSPVLMGVNTGPVAVGDMLRFHIDLPEAGFVYLFAISDSGKAECLHAPSADGEPKRYVVSPNEKEGWRVSGTQGVERFVVVQTRKRLSETELEDLQAALSSQLGRDFQNNRKVVRKLDTKLSFEDATGAERGGKVRGVDPQPGEMPRSPGQPVELQFPKSLEPSLIEIKGWIVPYGPPTDEK